MLKPIIAATAILGIAGSSIVYAQQQSGGHNGSGHWGHHGQHRHQVNPANFSALTDARIAALKAGLELTPDQQKNWPAFEQALRDVAQLRLQRIEARQAGHQHASAPQGATPQEGAAPQPGATPQQAQRDPFTRLSRRADALDKTSGALKKLANAGAPLYQSLTDVQKQRFKMLSRMLRPHHKRRMAFNEHNGGNGGGGGSGRNGHHRFGPGGGSRDGNGDGTGSPL
ncbi:MAG: Spy/CpxP family protein refolding chaperone [Xanthobacteraceae bacterium]